MKPDEKFTVTKHRTPSGLIIYTVYNYFGERVAKTTSQSRNYVALLLHHSPISGKFRVVHRFGRWDLVGKGDSQYVVGHPDYILVKVEDPQ